jgi:hypothetical protein
MTIPFAHVAGVPVEELIPTLAGSGGALLLARGWLALHLRRDDRRRRAVSRPAGRGGGQARR